MEEEEERRRKINLPKILVYLSLLRWLHALRSEQNTFTLIACALYVTTNRIMAPKSAPFKLIETEAIC